MVHKVTHDYYQMYFIGLLILKGINETLNFNISIPINGIEAMMNLVCSLDLKMPTVSLVDSHLVSSVILYSRKPKE